MKLVGYVRAGSIRTRTYRKSRVGITVKYVYTGMMRWPVVSGNINGAGGGLRPRKLEGGF